MDGYDTDHMIHIGSADIIDDTDVINPSLLTFLPRDASAERGNARVSRPSVCLSVCP